jgi:hypothetical protein
VIDYRGNLHAELICSGLQQATLPVESTVDYMQPGENVHNLHPEDRSLSTDRPNDRILG